MVSECLKAQYLCSAKRIRVMEREWCYRQKFNITVWRRNSISAQEVVRFQHLFPNPSVRKDIQSPKTRSNIPIDVRDPFGKNEKNVAAATLSFVWNHQLKFIHTNEKETRKFWIEL